MASQHRLHALACQGMPPIPLESITWQCDLLEACTETQVYRALRLPSGCIADGGRVWHAQSDSGPPFVLLFSSKITDAVHGIMDDCSTFLNIVMDLVHRHMDPGGWETASLLPRQQLTIIITVHSSSQATVDYHHHRQLIITGNSSIITGIS